ncbi:hypothetical protein ACJRO7_008868 [Eucalyptus globulus]|uniref:Uncharacterized protein n=1 Tax=Eucalyptus globulus TaxID=34317 RepID=A0ABD3ITR7_EUCGL
MKKILASKVAVAVMILLFLIEIATGPSEACRVLIKGHEGERASNKEPSLINLQTLQKGTPPCPTCSGYTPGSGTTASTTSTKAFAGRLAVAVPPLDYSNHVPQFGVAFNRK